MWLFPAFGNASPGLHFTFIWSSKSGPHVRGKLKTNLCNACCDSAVVCGSKPFSCWDSAWVELSCIELALDARMPRVWAQLAGESFIRCSAMSSAYCRITCDYVVWREHNVSMCGAHCKTSHPETGVRQKFGRPCSLGRAADVCPRRVHAKTDCTHIAGGRFAM